uniref:Uncharacterized protein n=1 Tax=Timema genevievae TaxID=629358 RepID=A0A7R9K1M6_TIMGE|nr:unnamed protein product [Timema genevievae]
MGANNVHALKLLGATKTNPYFELEGQRIITLYDPPHLLKWTRNMLYKHDVELPVLVDVLQGKPGTASWKDIREAHSLDSKNPLYCSLHKLGDDHLDPQYGAAMKVSTAAQVLSHTMASLISGYVASGTMPNTALGTARFAGLMDELFDSFNGTSLTPGGALGLKCQLRKEREALHLKFWNQALKDVDSLKFQRKQLNPSTTLHPEKFLTTVFRPPSQDGWIITIRAAKLLWKTLKDAGLTFLETRRLNQDAIEHLFDSICAHCGSNNNPTVQQFEAALKTCIVNGLAFRDLQGGNCEEDKDPASLLSTLQEFVRLVGDNTGTTLHVPSGRQSTVLIKTDIEKFHPLVGFESFSVAYVSGYIARRLLSGDTCKNCISSLVCSDPAELHYAGIYFKEYSEKLRGLTYPSAHLLKAVADGARILEDTLDSVAHLVGVKQRVASAIRKSCLADLRSLFKV